MKNINVTQSPIHSQTVQHRLLHKLFNGVWCGLTVQQCDNFQTGLNFVAQQFEACMDMFASSSQNVTYNSK